ncbi:MAG: acetyl-CoA carboxylase biotin carboxyl carrier protein subunit [Gammaproteobacteria bacterium]|nr:acetyl-CoA carboxylase biotin carboxyl carrier protein subunit [Gammaproteobacteria bacterium]
MKLTNEDVVEILRLLDASPFNELHVETSQFKLSLRRGDGQWTRTSEVMSKPKLAGVTALQAPPETARATPPQEPGLRHGLIDVRTPLPGTFYRAPQPGAAPFVEIGSRVEEHTVVCIVETMKLMNSIHAGARGTIREICRENGQFTEQETVLMRIEPERP